MMRTFSLVYLLVFFYANAFARIIVYTESGDSQEQLTAVAEKVCKSKEPNNRNVTKFINIIDCGQADKMAKQYLKRMEDNRAKYREILSKARGDFHAYEAEVKRAGLRSKENTKIGHTIFVCALDKQDSTYEKMLPARNGKKYVAQIGCSGGMVHQGTLKNKKDQVAIH